MAYLFVCFTFAASFSENVLIVFPVSFSSFDFLFHLFFRLRLQKY